MAYGARKTEHSGPKKSRGVFCGRKLAAERASSRRRRTESKRLARANGESQA